MAGTGTAHLRGGDALLRVEDLVVVYRTATGRAVPAVSGVSFDIRPGETLGIVGESGCGKSSTGRAIMQLVRPTSGSVRFESTELTGLTHRELRRARRRMQMVFQDPMSSLNPRRRVRSAVAEGLAIEGTLPKDEREARVDAALAAVGLDPLAVGSRRPRQFSGGQAQRICIARALTMSPSFLICDEPVSALDVSVQAQILNLLEDTKAEFGLTMLFIAHDLAVVKSISDVVMVMYKGKVCEVAPPDALFEAPAHPYTRLLIDSVPRPVPGRLTSEPVERDGEPADPSTETAGCRFRDRCPSATARCAEVEPEVRLLRAPDHFVACHHPDEAAWGG